VGRSHGGERRTPGGPVLLAAARQFACGLPGRISLRRAAALDELAQHRVIHPQTGEKPGRDHPALRRVRAQRPCVRARMRGHLWSPSYIAVSCGGAPLSIIKQYINGQARPL
jgi:Transposase IS200 like